MSTFQFNGLVRDVRGGAWLPDAVAWSWSALTTPTPARWRIAHDSGLGPPRTPDETADLLGVAGYRWRDRARAACGRLPASLLDEVAHAMTGDPVARAQTLVRFLVALDRACDGIALVDPRHLPELADMLDHARLDPNGNLARGAPPLVLPRGAPIPPGGAALGHYLQNLVVLDATALQGYDAGSVALPDWCRLAHRPGADSGTLAIAIVPTLERASDVEFRPVAGSVNRRFTIELEPKTQRVWIERAPRLVGDLEAARVELAVLPESVATPAVVDAFRAALVCNYGARGGQPCLRLMLIGRFRPRRNEVIALSGAGQRVLVQPKQQPWRLDVRQQQRYGVDRHLAVDGVSVDRDEDIMLATGPRMYAIDDEGFGRIVILTCEDLARCDPARGIAVALAPTDVIAPVMDAALAPGRWAATAAQPFAEEPGSMVVVANSCVLAQKQASSTARRVGVAFVAHPSWSVNRALHATVVDHDFLSWFQVLVLPRPN